MGQAILSSRRLGFVDSPKERVQFHSSELSEVLGLMSTSTSLWRFARFQTYFTCCSWKQEPEPEAITFLKDCNFRLRVKEGRGDSNVNEWTRSFHPNKTPLGGTPLTSGLSLASGDLLLSTITNLQSLLQRYFCSWSLFYFSISYVSPNALNLTHTWPAHPLALLITTMKCQRKKE